MEKKLTNIESLLLSIALCVYSLTFGVSIPKWVCFLPIIVSYWVVPLVNLVLALVADIKDEHRNREAFSHRNYGKPIHWNPETKSMYEDETNE